VYSVVRGEVLPTVQRGPRTSQVLPMDAHFTTLVEQQSPLVFLSQVCFPPLPLGSLIFKISTLRHLYLRFVPVHIFFFIGVIRENNQLTNTIVYYAFIFVAFVANDRLARSDVQQWFVFLLSGLSNESVWSIVNSKFS
jgi:hypothetical protein